jgi:cytochrome P450
MWGNIATARKVFIALLVNRGKGIYPLPVSVFYPKASKTIVGHKAVREALRDTQTYSSDLQGDSDVRDYRQLPLEVDPPRHHLYRVALAPYFVKPSIELLIPQFRSHTDTLIAEFFHQENLEVGQHLSLPLVMKNLGVIYNRPQDVDEWISWGPDVWTAESKERDGKVLHRYLDLIYEEALTKSKDDIWSQIAYFEIEGQQISAAEFRGIAGVMLAGGRDTVVKLFTGIMWHLGKKPQDLELLRSNPELLGPAIQEFLRFLTPLPAMNRTTVPESSTSDLPDDRYVGISFISGNFDETVFTNPFEIDFNRGRNPHLSFGFGPHTCLGNHIAEIEAKVFLEALLDSKINWKVFSGDIRFHQPPYSKIPDYFGAVKISAN